MIGLLESTSAFLSLTQKTLELDIKETGLATPMRHLLVPWS